MKDILLQKSISIGNELLATAQRSPEGIYWKSPQLDMLYYPTEKVVEYHVSPGMYNGNAGILFFLLELYRQTNESRFKEAVIEGARWLESYYESSGDIHCSLYTGRLGVSYLMLNIYELTDDISYQEKAVHIASQAPAFLKTQPKSELMNGAAGVLAGLLFLYDRTQSEELLRVVEQYAHYIIDRTSPGEKGVYWDSISNTIRGMCGFSHGVTGIGHVLLELGHYFDNKSFYWLAEQAFLYENSHYDKSMQNWPNFLKDDSSLKDAKEFAEAYRSNNLQFFETPTDTTAWCHGAAGIGLSRLRAYELLNDETYWLDAKRGLAKVESTDVGPGKREGAQGLCHGLSGDAFLFLEAARVKNDAGYFQVAMTVAEKIIDYHEKHHSYSFVLDCPEANRSPDLFLGISGIGYFFLTLYDSECRFLFPLLPRFENRHKGKHSSTLSVIETIEIRKTVLAKSFDRTMTLLQKISPEAYHSYFSLSTNGKNDEKTLFIHFFQSHVLTQEIPPQLQEIFSLEVTKTAMMELTPPLALLYMEEKESSAKVKENAVNESERMAGQQIKVSKRLKSLTTKWNWPLENRMAWLNNIELPEEEFSLVMIYTSAGIEEHWLSGFSVAILDICQTTKLPVEIFEEIKEAIEVPTEKETEVKAMIWDQVKELLGAGFLIFV